MTNPYVEIGQTIVGKDFPPYIIAEIGLNHNGSVELAKDHIKAAALSGANMVKFQKRDINVLATNQFLDAPFKKCPNFGRTQREVREKLELSIEQLKELKKYSESLGLDFSFSVFDIPSLEIALEMDLVVIKIPSHAATNFPLLERLSQQEKPIILSLGGTTWKEKNMITNVLKNNKIILLHCVSSYPTKDEEMKIETITELEKQFNRVIGHSGHEWSYELSAASILVGASIIERHFTLSRSMIGLDHKISLEPKEFSKMADLANRCYKSKGIISENIENNELASRENYHVSICSTRNIAQGEKIKVEDICCKQPRGPENKFFGGLEFKKIINSEVLENIPKDTPISKKSIKNVD